MLIRVIASVAAVGIGVGIMTVGVGIARDYRHIASNRYESLLAYRPLGRRTEKIDFAHYKRYISLPWLGFGLAVAALGVNGLAHL